MSEENNEIEIQHRELIDEENIDISDLPTEIKNAMRKFNAKLARYEENEDTNLFYELQQDDVAIANDILTWVEDNEADDDDEEEEDGTYLDDDDDNDYYANSGNSNQQTQQTQQNNNANQLEQKVLSMIKNNVISVEALQSVLGREPDYPFEQVGKLKLKKQYLKPFYEVA